MNELTNIMTIQLTCIQKANDDAVTAGILESRIPANIREVENILKSSLPGLDDVKIIGNQFFVNEKGGSNG